MLQSICSNHEPFDALARSFQGVPLAIPICRCENPMWFVEVLKVVTGAVARECEGEPAVAVVMSRCTEFAVAK